MQARLHWGFSSNPFRSLRVACLAPMKAALLAPGPVSTAGLYHLPARTRTAGLGQAYCSPQDSTAASLQLGASTSLHPVLGAAQVPSLDRYMGVKTAGAAPLGHEAGSRSRMGRLALSVSTSVRTLVTCGPCHPAGSHHEGDDHWHTCTDHAKGPGARSVQFTGFRIVSF